MAKKIIEKIIEVENVNDKFIKFKRDFSKNGKINTSWEELIIFYLLLERREQAIKEFKDTIGDYVKTTPFTVITEALGIGENEKAVIHGTDDKGNEYTAALKKTGGTTDFDIDGLVDFADNNPESAKDFGLTRTTHVTPQQIKQLIKDGKLDSLKDLWSEITVPEGTGWVKKTKKEEK